VERKIIVMPEAVTGNEISEGPMPDVPPVAVTTIEEARLYVDACDDWLSVGQPGMPTQEDILKQYGPALTKEASCSWALYGWPAESQLKFEAMLAQVAGLAEKYRARIELLTSQLEARQKAIEEFNAK
jgi:hypothetical protein